MRKIATFEAPYEHQEMQEKYIALLAHEQVVDFLKAATAVHME